VPRGGLLRNAFAGVALTSLVLAGCAHRPPLISTRIASQDAARAELVDVPFFPQERYQCGPAALATVLVAAGAEASPEDLAPQVFLPGRRGSLQLELIAAARRYGRLPYVIAPTLDDLLAQLRSGLPVLVLQNLGLESLPVWHYAVVIGFDAPEEALILRSGTERRLTMPAALFMRTWVGSDHWGLVVLDPGRLPANPEPPRYLRAAAGLEAAGQQAAAQAGYVAALRQWPDHPTALLGLGNTHYAQGELLQAARTYRRLVAVRPEDVIAHNNLAQVLADLGCREEALILSRRATALAEDEAKLQRAVARTQAQITAATANTAAGECPFPPA
jgi:tetratricopeptide (TPR) repeat protein